eukprot:COSAG01_NODE_33853_length_557_cov_1.137555_1_plen_33_part_10
MGVCALSVPAEDELQPLPDLRLQERDTRRGGEE